MTIKDQFKDDLLIFFDTDEFAEVITYTPYGSTARDINAIPQESGDVGIQSATPAYDRMTIVIRATDATAPSYRDTFTIKNSSGEDETWYMYNYLLGGHKSEIWTFELAKTSRV